MPLMNVVDLLSFWLTLECASAAFKLSHRPAVAGHHLNIVYEIFLSSAFSLAVDSLLQTRTSKKPKPTSHVTLLFQQ